MWMVPSKKVNGVGECFAVSSTSFHTSLHTRERATVSRRRSMSSRVPLIASSVGTSAWIWRATSSTRLSVTSTTFFGLDMPIAGTPQFLGIPAEPVLHIAALVGVVDQHIGPWHLGDAGIGLRQRRGLLEVGTDIGREVGADVGRVADGVGLGNQVRGAPRRAEHRAMVLGEVHLEVHRAQQLGRADAGAPGDLAGAGGGGLVQGIEVVGHHPAHVVGGLDLLARRGAGLCHRLSPIGVVS